ncbi:hypothetical protein CS542_00335 [Pedobacter sp. IW39]|nr:hypothetical protein CS542_00335 [Pedobacter sp. IW39]
MVFLTAILGINIILQNQSPPELVKVQYLLLLFWAGFSHLFAFLCPSKNMILTEINITATSCRNT